MRHDYDIVIIGTGMGGGTLAYALRDSGARLLLLERGDFLPQEPQNWSTEEVFDRRRYKPRETWLDAAGRPFHPGVHYFVGGNTKVYGAALPRLRRQDFEATEHEGGISPAWPIGYDDLEPYYARAEEIYLVHGASGADPTEPPRSGPFPFPPVPHEPYIAELAARLREQGLHPFELPMGIDLRPGGRCIRCKTCDGFPCRVLAKGDADVRAVRPALESPNVELWTNTYARRLLTDPAGRRVIAVEVERAGERLEVSAPIVVVACGAANSAALLLRSANDQHPNGLANGSDVVGRHYMRHNNLALMAVSREPNPTSFQKTLALHDWYLGADDWDYPLGGIQMLGKSDSEQIKGEAPRWAAWASPKMPFEVLAHHAVDFWLCGEDLPQP
jgi:choline dehydrogenase-like flavoprotein